MELERNSDDQDIYILRSDPIKNNHHLCLLKLKQPKDPILLQPNLLVFIQMQNLNRFRTGISSLNILTQQFNY